MRSYRFIAAALASFMLFAVTTAQAAQVNRYPPVVIGVVVPIQIQAVNEIVKGFTSTLHKLYPGKITFLIQNAQGDINLQRTIIQQFKERHVNVVVPIGTTPTEMTINLIKKQPIVALAAVYTNKQRLMQKPRNTTNVSDEIMPAKQLAFLHQAIPSLKKITLIHSTDPKVFHTVKEIKRIASHYGLTIQELTMQQLPDLYTLGQQIDRNSQAILVLKDLLVVSGIRTLAHDANMRHIPLIASDDGSVEKGAAFALGVEERQIGIDGAKLVSQVLHGTPIANIPVKLIHQYKLFINPKAADQQGVNLSILRRTAIKMEYPLVTMNKGIVN